MYLQKLGSNRNKSSPQHLCISALDSSLMLFLTFRHPFSPFCTHQYCAHCSSPILNIVFQSHVWSFPLLPHLTPYFLHSPNLLMLPLVAFPRCSLGVPSSAPGTFMNARPEEPRNLEENAVSHKHPQQISSSPSSFISLVCE